MNHEANRWLEVRGWWKRFRGSLGFWGLHCVISAMPGFSIAMKYLDARKSPVAIVAMLLAVGTFAVLITLIASLRRITGEPKQMLFSRGLKTGLVLRGLMCGATLLVIVIEPESYTVLFCMPDVWAGIGAVLSVGLVLESLGLGRLLDVSMDSGIDAAGAIAIYMISLIHGLILCFLIFILSFVSMLVLQMRDRGKMYSEGQGMASAFLCRILAMGPGHAMRVSGSRFLTSERMPGNRNLVDENDADCLGDAISQTSGLPGCRGRGGRR